MHSEGKEPEDRNEEGFVGRSKYCIYEDCVGRGMFMMFVILFILFFYGIRSQENRFTAMLNSFKVAKFLPVSVACKSIVDACNSFEV